jgi:hypothetical protein
VGIATLKRVAMIASDGIIGPRSIILVLRRGLITRDLCQGGEKKMEKRTIDVKSIYGETAKLALLLEYEEKAVELAGEGNEVILTGAGPVWLYLRLAHKLHGKCVTLKYDSPATDEVVVFDHNPR